MILILLFALSFGSSDMSFPWWVWLLALANFFWEGGSRVKQMRGLSNASNGDGVTVIRRMK